MQDHKHTFTDPGHAHPYVDHWPNGDGTHHSNGHWGSAAGMDQIADRWDQPHDVTTSGTTTNAQVKHHTTKECVPI